MSKYLKYIWYIFFFSAWLLSLMLKSSLGHKDIYTASVNQGQHACVHCLIKGVGSGEVFIMCVSLPKSANHNSSRKQFLLYFFFERENKVLTFREMSRLLNNNK